MCASANMASYTIEINKLGIKGNHVVVQPVSSQLFSENDLIMMYVVEESSIYSLSFIDSIILLRKMWMWPTI